MAQKKIFTTDGPLMADETTGAALVALAPYTTGGIGAKDCAAADTNYTLGAQACRAVVLSAHPDNAGRLWIGIGEAAVEGQGKHLEAGDPIGYGLSNTNMVNVLAETAGDDLCYQWVN